MSAIPRTNLKKYIAIEMNGGPKGFHYALLIDPYGLGPDADTTETVAWFNKMGDAAFVANVMNNHLYNTNKGD